MRFEQFELAIDLANQVEAKIRKNNYHYEKFEIIMPKW